MSGPNVVCRSQGDTCENLEHRLLYILLYSHASEIHRLDPQLCFCKARSKALVDRKLSACCWEILVNLGHLMAGETKGECRLEAITARARLISSARL